MKNEIPQGTLIEQFLPADYSDVYTCDVVAESLNADDIQVNFWTRLPKWIAFLFNIRGWLVKLVGLKGGGSNPQAMENCIRKGTPYDMASIPAKNENETILQLDDSHLSALFSVYIQSLEGNLKSVSLTTLVHFHKRLGYIYFYAIRPFHHIVVKQMLKKAVKLASK